MRPCLITSVCLAALVGACGFQLNDPNENAPRLSLEFPSESTLFITWWYPPANAAEFVLEERAGSGAFRDVAHFAGNEARANYPLTADGLYGKLEFRLRAEPGGLRSTNIVINRAVPPPLSIAVSAGPASFAVDYERPWPTQIPVALSRRTTQSNGTSGAWAQLAVGAEQVNRYVDTDLSGWTDGAHYEYQAVAFVGNEQSAPVTGKTLDAPFLAAVLVSANADATGVHLTFKSRSTQSARVQISRREPSSYNATTVADLPAPAPGVIAAFDDRGVAAGIYQYDVTTGTDFGQTHSASWVVVSPPTLTGAIADLPPGFQVARAPSGAFAVLTVLEVPPPNAGSTITQVIALLPPGDEGQHYLPLPFGFPRREPVLDRDGHPHVVYDLNRSSNGRTLVHAWHDGQQWSSEQIGFFPVDGNVEFAIGADGTLHAAWASSRAPAHVARRVQGAWQVEEVTAFSTLVTPSLMLAGDENGNPHLIVPTSEVASLHAFRAADGWHVENVPAMRAGAMTLSISRSALFLFAAAGRVTVGERLFDPALQRSLVSVIERTASGWGAPDEVLESGNGSSAPNLAAYHAAISVDGTRVVVASIDGAVLTREGGNRTQRNWPPATTSGFGVGFTPTGRIWRLDYIRDARLSAIPPRPGNAVLYEGG